MSIKILKNLSGHSGCNIYLCQSDNVLFVRKDAGSVNYNIRLKKQYIKQKYFALNEAKTPQVLGYGKKDGIFYFDMEFVNGITLSEYMYQIKIKEIVDFIAVLFNALKITESKINPIANRIFQTKINLLNAKVDISKSCVIEAFRKLRNFDFSSVPCSPCCGDLTLENIILAPMGNLYLIDLLDSFYNSWQLDVAKLLQDLDLGWSYRHRGRNYNLNLRLETAKQALFDNILSFPEGKVWLQQIYYILLLNVLRIYPYARDKETLDFLDSSTEYLLNRLKKMEE